MADKNEDARRSGNTRRAFLYGAGAAGAALATDATVSAVPSRGAKIAWAQEADVVVVGSGAAGLSAAIAAVRGGAKVIVLEGAPVVGGTTLRSSGGYWIPNNLHMRAKNIADSREAAIDYMARVSYPVTYRPDMAHHGLDEFSYGLIEAFYDNAAPVTDELHESGILKSQILPVSDYLEVPQNKAPVGRCLVPVKPDGAIGMGIEMIRQFRSWLTANNVPILIKHRVERVIKNGEGEIVGVAASTDKGETLIRARKAVIFGSGGYAHNVDLLQTFQLGPVYGGCAVPTARGDFINIGIEAGAALGNMASAWRSQVFLEQALQNRSVSKSLEFPPGDSMIFVSKYGRRVVNEKRDYNARSRIHYIWDPVKGEYANQFLFMIYDRRTAELFAGDMLLPEPGTTAPFVISASDMPGLAKAIQERLASLKDKIGDYRLAPDFVDALTAQVTLFNADARTGEDSQFQRGGQFYDVDWHRNYMSPERKDTKWPPNPGPNYTMYPFDKNGPYFAIILAPGLLDTNGGPVINAKSQVLSPRGKPISGLYGAGNCIANPGAQGYWGAGSTLGPAITFGTIAGRNAAGEPIKAA